jgi:hypothetical protein
MRAYSFTSFITVAALAALAACSSDDPAGERGDGPVVDNFAECSHEPLDPNHDWDGIPTRSILEDVMASHRVEGRLALERMQGELALRAQGDALYLGGDCNEGQVRVEMRLDLVSIDGGPALMRDWSPGTLSIYGADSIRLLADDDSIESALFGIIEDGSVALREVWIQRDTLYPPSEPGDEPAP